MNAEYWRKFLDSLDGEKGLPEEMHGWRFSTDIDDFGIDDYAVLDGAHFQNNFVAYLMERVRRAESRQIPDLKEKVKAFGIACMNAEKDSYETDGSVDFDAAGKRVEELRALCAPEAKP